MSFTHTITDRYPATLDQRSWAKFQGQPPIDEIVGEAQAAVSEIEQFRQLPEFNQRVLLHMAEYMIAKANEITYADWRGNYWGLYIVGSRAQAKARPDSDLDLLSAGTYYRHLGFQEPYWVEDAPSTFADFEIDAPIELPDEYNVGEVDRKYLFRARPKVEGAIPIDLSVVDLTFTDDLFEDFKNRLDVDNDGEPLTRLPLIELVVPIRD